MRSTTAPREVRNINVWPDNPLGHGAADLKYRFQWNFPIFFSPHDPNTLYAAGNVLFRTTNEGQSWQPISPDLTRNDKSKHGPSGGPITKDNTSVEYYCTIFAALESPHEKGVLWCGTDDGLLHLSRDGGKNWTKVTPPDLPEWSMINSLEAHPTEKGGLYLAATRYKLDDFRPYLYKTTDYGKTWTKIVTGIKDDHFTRVVRADPKRPGLLYAGTESGMYVSFDDGGELEAVPAQPADRADHRPGDQERRPDRRDPGAVVLGARRPDAAAPTEARDRESAAARVPAAFAVPPARRPSRRRRRGRPAVADRRPEPAGRRRDPLPPEGGAGEGREEPARDPRRERRRWSANTRATPTRPARSSTRRPA